MKLATRWGWLGQSLRCPRTETIWGVAASAPGTRAMIWGVADSAPGTQRALLGDRTAASWRETNGAALG